MLKSFGGLGEQLVQANFSELKRYSIYNYLSDDGYTHNIVRNGYDDDISELEIVNFKIDDTAKEAIRNGKYTAGFAFKHYIEKVLQDDNPILGIHLIKDFGVMIAVKPKNFDLTLINDKNLEKPRIVRKFAAEINFNHMNCSKIFDKMVEDTKQYLLDNNLKSMVLGISGGIDSTVLAAICSEVSKETGIPLIGRSLTIKNKPEEYNTASMVGNAFCNEFCEVNLLSAYNEMLKTISEDDKFPHEGTPISRGNIQARLRMTYLYNLAGVTNGLVMDTDNLTEHYLGFFTIHGDVCDFNPIGELWKTEVYELARWMCESYECMGLTDKAEALQRSIGLTPTDGLGISNSDLEQIGAKSYADVDKILQFVVYKQPKQLSELYDKFGRDVVDKVVDRYLRSEYKRKKLPIVIPLRKEEYGCMNSNYYNTIKNPGNA